MDRRLSNKLRQICHIRYVIEWLKSSFGKFYGQYRDLIKQYEVSRHSEVWLGAHNDFPTDQTLRNFNDLDAETDLYRITRGLHKVSAICVACQQGRFYPPSSVPMGFAYALYVETSFPNLSGLFTFKILRCLFRFLYFNSSCLFSAFFTLTLHVCLVH